jgi:hypothetical protein
MADEAELRLTARDVERGEVRVGVSTHHFDSSAIKGMPTAECDWRLHVIDPDSVVLGCRGAQATQFASVVELEHGRIVASYLRREDE